MCQIAAVVVLSTVMCPTLLPCLDVHRLDLPLSSLYHLHLMNPEWVAKVQSVLDCYVHVFML